MKKNIISIFMIILTIALTPLISVLINTGDYDKTNIGNVKQAVATVEKSAEKVTENDSRQTTESTEKKISATEKLNFKIYDKSVKKVITVSDFDFCCGATATETDTDIPYEALKSEIVALHTYYSYLRNESRKNKKDFDFECNSKVWEVYASETQIKEKLRDTFDENYDTIKKAVTEVIDTFVLYDNKVCMTKYFEISCGNTFSYNEIFGENIPYLQSVPSPFDTVANNYKTQISLSADEFNKKISESFDNYKPSENLSENISDISKTENNAVISLKIGNCETKGENFVNIFNLRSRCFDVAFKDNSYIITTYGYGENIGLSKFGACKLAEQGYNFIEILQYYYPDTTILDGYSPC